MAIWWALTSTAQRWVFASQLLPVNGFITVRWSFLLRNKINRERVFILATRGAFHFEDRSICSQVFAVGSCSRCPSSHDLLFVAWQQDVSLMTEGMMEQRAHSPWNPGQKPMLHKWLVRDQNDEDQRRLKAIGNVVMPRVGQLGAHLLEHRLRAERFNK